MSSVAKREFFSAFHRLYAFVTVSITVLASVILFWICNLGRSSESIADVISIQALLVSLILPITAVSMFPNRKKNDTDVIYDMLPLSASDVYLGKYFASLAITLIPTVFMATYPIIAGMYYKVSVGISYSYLLAYALFEAALLAILTFISANTKSSLRAYVYCYVTIAVWYLISVFDVIIPLSPLVSFICLCVIAVLVAVWLYFLTRKLVFVICIGVAAEIALTVAYVVNGDGFVRLFEKIIDSLSLFSRINVFSFGISSFENEFSVGIFNLESILFFLIVAAAFLFLGVRRYAGRNLRKKREGLKITSITSVATAICTVAVALAANFAVSAIPNPYTHFDITETSRNSVSEEAKKFLSKVEEDVTIYVLESVDYKEYELYLEKVAACNPRISVRRVYYTNTPEFYYEYGIDPDAITANSLLIECGDRAEYLSYFEMFTYTNSTLGMNEANASDYQYYYQLFSSSDDYVQYLYSLLYETTINFNADYYICYYIEYLTADIIPKNYYLKGHGTADVNSDTSPYNSIGMVALDLSSAEAVPADAASVFINMPKEDVTESEKEALLAYLERGGQITLVGGSEVMDMNNLYFVLNTYGMSAEKDFVTVKAESEEESQNGEKTTSFSAVPEFALHDVFEYIDGASIDISVTDANKIFCDSSVLGMLVHYPLLYAEDTVTNNDGEKSTLSHIVACAAETTDKGGRLLWFTGGESFNSAKSNSCIAVMCALGWVTLEYTSNVGDVQSVVYQEPEAIISGSTGLVAALLAALPIVFMAFGTILFYKRKKAK